MCRHHILTLDGHHHLRYLRMLDGDDKEIPLIHVLQLLLNYMEKNQEIIRIRRVSNYKIFLAKVRYPVCPNMLKLGLVP